MASRSVIFIAVIIVSAAPQASETETAAVFAKAAEAIFSTDFIWDPPEETFSDDELAVLKAHSVALERMICASLGAGNSVVGADLMAYFGLKECLAQLRFRLLAPGHYYGWEGAVIDGREHLSDRHYVYHSRYIVALETLFPDQRVLSVLALTQKEQDALRSLSQNLTSAHQRWATWMLHRLRIEI